MEGTPEYLDYTEIMETFLSIDGVVRVHNLRIWVRIIKLNELAISSVSLVFLTTLLFNPLGSERQQSCISSSPRCR